jgi:serine/threonine-protein kinase HipA
VAQHFFLLAEHAGIAGATAQKIFQDMLSPSDAVLTLVDASFLDVHSRRAFLQSYQTRRKKLAR